MKFNAQQYLDCSRLRVESARRLHEQSRYSAAIYLAGVGIECLLRVETALQLQAKGELLWRSKKK